MTRQVNIVRLSLSQLMARQVDIVRLSLSQLMARQVNIVRLSIFTITAHGQTGEYCTAFYIHYHST